MQESTHRDPDQRRLGSALRTTLRTPGQEPLVVAKVKPFRSGKPRFLVLDGGGWADPAVDGGRPVEAVEEIEGVPELFGDSALRLAKGAAR